jgi:hypothetical protein
MRFPVHLDIRLLDWSSPNYLEAKLRVHPALLPAAPAVGLVTLGLWRISPAVAFLWSDFAVIIGRLNARLESMDRKIHWALDSIAEILPGPSKEPERRKFCLSLSVEYPEDLQSTLDE